MSELLTVKEVQDLLKIDRITVYRMLRNGRLTGVKIGHQWRFSRSEIDSLFSGGAAQAHVAILEHDAPNRTANIAIKSMHICILMALGVAYCTSSTFRG